jgi:hypothetical protein
MTDDRMQTHGQHDRCEGAAGSAAIQVGSEPGQHGRHQAGGPCGTVDSKREKPAIKPPGGQRISL